MVAVGRNVAHINGDPCLIAWAVVRGRVDEKDASVFRDAADRYWLDVYVIPGGEPMPQMYAAGEILGVPALGLTMKGAPPPLDR